MLKWSIWNQQYCLTQCFKFVYNCTQFVCICLCIFVVYLLDRCWRSAWIAEQSISKHQWQHFVSWLQIPSLQFTLLIFNILSFISMMSVNIDTVYWSLSSLSIITLATFSFALITYWLIPYILQVPIELLISETVPTHTERRWKWVIELTAAIFTMKFFLTATSSSRKSINGPYAMKRFCAAIVVVKMADTSQDWTAEVIFSCPVL